MHTFTADTARTSEPTAAAPGAKGIGSGGTTQQ